MTSIILRSHALRTSRRGDRLPLLAGVTTAIVGLVNVGSAATPELPSRMRALRALVPGDAVLAANALALPAGLALVVMAYYLARRNRRALRAVVGLLVAIAGLNLLKGLDLEEALLSLGLAGGLVWGRDAFCATQTGRRGRASELPGAEVLSAVRALVCSHGTDTLSFFKLRSDLHHLFSPDGRAFASYRVVSGVMLVSGDPVGPADALPAVVREVCAFAEVRGLRVGVLGASEELAGVWAQAGLRSLYLGDEAIIDTATFSLEGRRIRKVRQSVSRAHKAGYVAELRTFGELAEDEVAGLEAVSDRWRGGEPERGFSMALDSMRGEHLADSSVVIARGSDGAVHGFLHYVPAYGRPAMSLGFMRRDPDTPNGLTEFMVVRSIELLREQGVEELSLNFAAFARMMHSPDGWSDRALGRIAKAFNPYFQIESLYRFNAKFFPRWQPRYALWEGTVLGFPQTAVAAMRAEGLIGAA